MYLNSASPHRQHGDEKAWETLRRIMDDQHLMIDKIAEQVESSDGSPNMGEFPMDFTGAHDLSMAYMMQQVLERQRQEVGAIERLSSQLDSGSQAKALAQEALGAAKAHVQSLEECISTVA
jgi:hypothetical protein